MPELHVNSARYYYIFQYKDKNVWVYKNLSPYPYYYALQNGAFISHRMGAGPLSDEYKYLFLIHLVMKFLVLDLPNTMKMVMEHMMKMMNIYLTM